MQYGNHVWVDLFFITFWGLLIIFFKMRLFTVWIRSKFQRITEECVFLIVIWPEFHTGQYWFDILATHASLQLLLMALVSLLCYWIRNNLTLSWDPTRTGDPHARHLHFDIFPFYPRGLEFLWIQFPKFLFNHQRKCSKSRQSPNALRKFSNCIKPMRIWGSMSPEDLKWRQRIKHFHLPFFHFCKLITWLINW